MPKESRFLAKSFKKPSSSLLLAFFFFSLGTLLLLSLLSFHSKDPSMWSNSRAIPQNAFGRLGASVSAFLFGFFGLLAFLPPWVSFLAAWSVFWDGKGGGKQSDFFSGFGAWFGCLLSGVLLLSLHFTQFEWGGKAFLVGGVYGHSLASLLEKELNLFGASWILFCVFVFSIILASPSRFLKFCSGFFLRLLLGLVQLVFFTFTTLNSASRRFMRHIVKQLTKQVANTGGFEGKTLASRTSLLTSQPTQLLSQSLAQAPSSNKEPKKVPEKLLEKTNKKEPLLYARYEPPKKPRTAQTSLSGRQEKAYKWTLPSIEFLRQPPEVQTEYDREKLRKNADILTQKFADFGIPGEVTGIRPGPVITLYEFRPGPGIKVSRITALCDDLSMALSAQSVRILAPLPGKAVVGIEIPSEDREMVYLRELLEHKDFYGARLSIPVAMGKDTAGNPYLADLARMPHLLCAGQTGSGKSVFMNGLICSLFYRFSPAELRMILVDPKFIEFRAYRDIPHLLLPVVDDPHQATLALKWAVREMERRYRILAKFGSRNLASFNQKMSERLLKSQSRSQSVSRDEGEVDLNLEEDLPEEDLLEEDLKEAFERDANGQILFAPLPSIVIVIDELADLMMVAKKEVEISIARIAQKARAAGIHLVIATQRPSTDVITGLIKANLPSRLSFQLASFVDSKTILDRSGAERLLGQGDLLFIPPGSSHALRLHAAYLDDDEIEKITGYLRSQGSPKYRDEILDEKEQERGQQAGELSERLEEGIEGGLEDLISSNIRPTRKTSKENWERA